MEWSKLKNIILLLLVSVNAFLLILVGVQESRAARYEEDTRQAAVRVLEQSGITFGPERVPQEAGLSPLTVTRDRESEAIVAQTLLGDVSREGENDVRHRNSQRSLSATSWAMMLTSGSTGCGQRFWRTRCMWS